MMPEDGIDGALTRFYNWWVDLMFALTIWWHRLYAKYMTTYIVFFWMMMYLQLYFEVMLGIATIFHTHLLVENAGSPYLTTQFLAIPATATIASILAYIESKRVVWVLTRIAMSLGPMFRRRLKKVVKLDKKETLIEDFNGILDRFLKKVEAQKLAIKGTDRKGRISLTKAEAIAVLKSVIDDEPKGT